MRLPVLLLAVLMLCLSSAVASTSTDERVPAARTEHTDGSLKLTVVDVSPRFLDFYAVAREADADARWALWDRRYGFAAVPPSPVLEASDSDTVFRFTMGEGTTGTEREAYVAGWLVIDELLRQGRTLPELARVRPEDMPALVRGAIASISARR